MDPLGYGKEKEVVETLTPLHLVRIDDDDDESARPLIGWTPSSGLLNEASQAMVMPWVVVVSEYDGREMDRQVVPLDRGWVAIDCRAVGANMVHAAVAWANTEQAHHQLGRAITARSKRGELRWELLQPVYPEQLRAQEAVRSQENRVHFLQRELTAREASLPKRRSSRRSGQGAASKAALTRLRQDLMTAQQTLSDKRDDYWQLHTTEEPIYQLTPMNIDWDGEGEASRSCWDVQFHGQTCLEVHISEKAFLPMEKGLAHKFARGVGRRQPKDQCDQRRQAMVGVVRTVVSSAFWLLSGAIFVLVLTVMAAVLWLWGRRGVNIRQLPEVLRSDEQRMSDLVAPVLGRPNPSRWIAQAEPGEFGTRYVDYPMWRRALINPASWALVGLWVVWRQASETGLVTEIALYLAMAVCAFLVFGSTIGRALDNYMDQKNVGREERKRRQQAAQHQRLQQQLVSLTEAEVKPPDYVVAARAIKGRVCKSFAINR